jgi:F420-dependent oxidoreductase-like protein
LLAERAEALGYHGLWVPESWGRDAFTLLARIAANTKSLHLGTGIVNVFSRSPAVLAQTAVSLDEMTGGRFTLGLGTSGPRVIERWHGVPYQRALQRLRETIEIVRQIVRRDRLDHSGEVFQLGDFKLLCHPVRPEIPIYVAALSPASLRLTGEVADGWLPVFVSLQHLNVVRGDLEAGAARREAGRAPLRMAPYIAVGVDSDPMVARDLVRPHLARYVGGMGAFYNQLVRRYGFEAEAEAIAAAWAGGERRGVASLVTDAMVDALAVAGDPAACRERFAAYEAAGFDELVLAVEAPDMERSLAAVEALAPGTKT